MELSTLLGTRFTCDCGRVHEVPVRELVYEAGAVRSLPDIVRRCVGSGPLKRAAIVADVRTWDISGQQAQDALAAAGLDATRIIVVDRENGGPVCDEATSETLIGGLRPAMPDLVVAVGSGVINDLCKWAAFELGIPYVVVATAASMNGYSSANVAPTIAGVKRLVKARAPLAVVAEPAVIEQAPREMTTAGFGDVIAKHQSNADWIMNNLLSDEYRCEFCAGIVNELEPLYLDHPEGIRNGESEAVRGLFEALFWTGMAMTLVGTSVPASGGEHLLSHTLDMIAAVRGDEHDLHGRQVGVGTLFSAALFEKVLAMDSPVVRDLPPAVDDRFWAVASVVAAVKEQYEAKRQRLGPIIEKVSQPEVWEQLRTRLRAAVQKPQTIQSWLKGAGAAVSTVDIGCSRERIRSAILHMHEIRTRFTVIDLAWLVGILPDETDRLIDEYLAGSHR